MNRKGIYPSKRYLKNRLKRFRALTGLTLVELLVATVIGAFVFGAILFFYAQSMKSSNALGTEADIQQYARKALDQLAAELKRGRPATTTISGSEIKVWLPVFSVAGSGCSAYNIPAEGQSPVSCANTGACSATCGAGTYNCNILATSNIGTCEKQYKYSSVTSNGISKLVSYELDGTGNTTGSPHILANQIQPPSFSNAGLGTHEARVSLTAQGTSRYENRTRTATAWTIVHMRN